jgi:GrpB-like predicted nucleotidyltransferase (UPF0157 family)
VAPQYEDLKRELAAKHRHDVPSDGEAKTSFIGEIEEQAREYYDCR